MFDTELCLWIDVCGCECCPECCDHFTPLDDDDECLIPDGVEEFTNEWWAYLGVMMDDED